MSGEIKKKYVLSNCVAEKRKLFNMSQIEVANAIGCSRNTISRIERNEFEPTAYVAALLCQLFLCSFEDLFFLTEKE